MFCGVIKPVGEEKRRKRKPGAVRETGGGEKERDREKEKIERENERESENERENEREVEKPVPSSNVSYPTQHLHADLLMKNSLDFSRIIFASSSVSLLLDVSASLSGLACLSLQFCSSLLLHRSLSLFI